MKNNVKLEMETMFGFDKITGGKEKKRLSDCLPNADFYFRRVTHHSQNSVKHIKHNRTENIYMIVTASTISWAI